MNTFKPFLSLIVIIMFLNFGKIHANLQWNDELGYSWTDNCVFKSEKTLIRQIELITKESCADNCRTTIGCTHYYMGAIREIDGMRSYWRGVCFLRKDFVTKADVVVYNDPNYPTSCGFFYPGNKKQFFFAKKYFIFNN